MLGGLALRFMVWTIKVENRKDSAFGIENSLKRQRQDHPAQSHSQGLLRNFQSFEKLLGVFVVFLNLAVSESVLHAREYSKLRCKSKHSDS